MATWRLWTKYDALGIRPPEGGGRDDLTARLRALPTSGYEHVSGGKIPRNHTPRAYRLSVGRDVVGAVSVQFRRMRNCLEVGAMLPHQRVDGPLLAELLRFVLTEAYRCGGGCALRFARSESKPGRRPRPGALEALEAVRGLAETLGIEIRGSADLDITADEGRRLYLALSGLSDLACGRVERLEQQGRARAESVSFLVQSGVWTATEMEGILLSCPYPDVVFRGGAAPADRHLARLAMDHARAAVLGGRLDRFLVSRWEESEDRVRSLVNEPRSVVIRVGDPPGSRSYRVGDEPVPLGDWLRSHRTTAIPADGELLAWVLPRSREDLARSWKEDLRVVRTGTGPLAPGTLTTLVVPSDFDQIGAEVRQDLLQRAEQAGVGVLVAPDTFPQISLEARRRLSYSRTIRR